MSGQLFPGIRIRSEKKVEKRPGLVGTLEEHLSDLTKRHFEKLPLCPATIDFNLGTVTVNRRLKPRLFQDLL